MTEKKKALGLPLSSNKMKNQNISIPNLVSHKKKIIKDLNKKNIKQTSRADLIKSLSQKLEQSNTTNYISLSSLTEDAKANDNLYDINNDTNIMNIEQDPKFNQINKDNSKRAYGKILDHVIENSDIILEVLDVRDPLGCRSTTLESQILNQKDIKKIILVLNKMDLVPISNALLWQKYLKREYPCVLFKSNTQNQSSHLSQSSLFTQNYSDDIIEKSSGAIGAEGLLNILKNYSREGNMKKTVTVGIVGYPNVGKSSVINSLKRGRVVGVSSTPGFTKGIQEINLDGNIKLIDCPGVVFNVSNNLLQNCVSVQEIKEPVEVVNSILQKIPLDELKETYQIDPSIFGTNLLSNLSTDRLLFLIGEKHKKYKQGGLIDFDKTARMVIIDWNEGKLKYFSVPPGVDKDLYMKELNSGEVNKDIDMKQR